MKNLGNTCNSINFNLKHFNIRKIFAIFNEVKEILLFCVLFQSTERLKRGIMLNTAPHTPRRGAKNTRKLHEQVPRRGI